MPCRAFPEGRTAIAPMHKNEEIQTSSNRAMHSVSQLIDRRKREKSLPGQRTDGRLLALAIEGGGMRGVVCGGMVAALEQLELLNTFDVVYGSSAGAISGAYFVAGQARLGVTIFYQNIANRQFINMYRFLLGRPILSLEFLLDRVCIFEKKLNTDAIIRSPVPLKILATSTSKLEIVVFDNFSDDRDLFDALRCSARIPVIAGPPVQYRNDTFLDASILESIPYRSAISAGATDIVVLMTRPAGSLRGNADRIDKYFIAPQLRKYNPKLPHAYLDRANEYLSEVEAITAASKGQGPTRILPVQISATAVDVPSNCIDRNALVEGAMAGFRAVYAALGLVEPTLAELITPLDP